MFFVNLLKHSEFVNRIFQKKLMIPPLSGYTDFSYRKILATFSPPFLCTEMISPYEIIKKNPKIMRMLEKIEGNHFSGVQLVGNEPNNMVKAAKIIQELGYDYIDINMGCTVKTITKIGAGIALMKSEEKASKIISSIINAVEIPVTCKISLGINKEKLNFIQFSKKMVEAGVSAIIVHGRSGEKKVGLPVDYFRLKEVVDNVKIPIIANGNIFSGEDAKKMLTLTGAVAVMPGRGLIGNPWLISEILNIIENKAYVHPDIEERKRVCTQHAVELCNFYGENRGIVKMRKILPEYFRYTKNVTLMKNDVQQIKSFNEFLSLINRVTITSSMLQYN